MLFRIDVLINLWVTVHPLFRELFQFIPYFESCSGSLLLRINVLSEISFHSGLPIIDFANLLENRLAHHISCQKAPSLRMRWCCQETLRRQKRITKTGSHWWIISTIHFTPNRSGYWWMISVIHSRFYQHTSTIQHAFTKFSFRPGLYWRNFVGFQWE